MVQIAAMSHSSSNVVVQAGDWEGTQARFIDYPGVVKHYVNSTPPDMDVFYVAGADHYDRNIRREHLGQARVIRVPRAASDVSSTKIRKTRSLTKLQNMVPGAVADYIVKHRLYSFHDYTPQIGTGAAGETKNTGNKGMRRVVCIGDLHGNLAETQQLWTSLEQRQRG